MKKLVSFLVAAVSVCATGCVSDVANQEEELRIRCGGITGAVCPEGYSCADDRHDSCDPTAGDADCGGFCRRSRRARCDYNVPDKNYIGRSADECSRIRFACVPGTEYFADECGCGCRDSGSACASIGLCVEGFVWDDVRCECVSADTQCGGLTGASCPSADQICVDNPFDGCDPQNGGADCSGVCRDSICSGQTARCAAGFYWSRYHCNCVENPCNVMDCAPGYTCEVRDDATRGECVPEVTASDCRTTGCEVGQYCSFCWSGYACIPDGAVC